MREGNFSEFCAQCKHLQSSLTCLGVDWVAGTRRLIPWVIRDGMLYINNSRIIPRPDTGSNILKDINNCSIACLNTDITKIVCVANHTNDFTCLLVTSCKHLQRIVKNKPFWPRLLFTMFITSWTVEDKKLNQISDIKCSQILGVLILTGVGVNTQPQTTVRKKC